jgi:hypothetical protein
MEIWVQPKGCATGCPESQRAAKLSAALIPEIAFDYQRVDLSGLVLVGCSVILRGERFCAKHFFDELDCLLAHLSEFESSATASLTTESHQLSFTCATALHEYIDFS